MILQKTSQGGVCRFSSVSSSRFNAKPLTLSLLINQRRFSSNMNRRQISEELSDPHRVVTKIFSEADDTHTDKIYMESARNQQVFSASEGLGKTRATGSMLHLLSVYPGSFFVYGKDYGSKDVETIAREIQARINESPKNETTNNNNNSKTDPNHDERSRKLEILDHGLRSLIFCRRHAFYMFATNFPEKSPRDWLMAQLFPIEFFKGTDGFVDNAMRVFTKVKPSELKELFMEFPKDGDYLTVVDEAHHLAGLPRFPQPSSTESTPPVMDGFLETFAAQSRVLDGRGPIYVGVKDSSSSSMNHLVEAISKTEWKNPTIDEESFFY